MKIAKEIIDRGYIEIDRFDVEGWKAVNDYNSSTEKAIDKLKNIYGLKRIFKISNILTMVLLYIIQLGKILSSSLYAAAATFLLVALILCMVKRAHRIYAIVSFAFAIFDLRYVLVGIVNLVTYILISRQEKKLSQMPGFPHFNKLKIVTVEPKKEVDKFGYYEYPKNM